MITRFRKIYPLFALSLLLFALLNSCKKSATQSPLANLNIDVSKGGFGVVVTITGTGFSSNQIDDHVTFNGKPAEVISASTDKLIVKVPVGAGTGNVSVSVNGATVTGPIFTYTLTPLVTTYAGSGIKGYADGTSKKAAFTYPIAIVVDANDNLYVSDAGDGISRVRKISPDSVVTTLVTLRDAPSGTPPFEYIMAMKIGADGNIYAVENGGVVRKITMSGIVTTYYRGSGGAAGIAFDKSNNMYISLSKSNQVQVVTPAGVASNFVGTGGYGDTDVFLGSFSNNTGIEFDAAGLLYIADFNNNKIRVAGADRHVTTIVGFSQPGSINGNAHDDGPLASAKLGNPNDIKFDAAGNLYFTDSGNHMVRMIDAAHTRVTTIAGTATATGGYKDGAGSVALFNVPTCLAISKAGTIFVTDQVNNVIRKIVMI
ncbi:MAG: hypothetical protein JWR05_3367 [Mucilaginibacter sp.]|nr:hypothetical protein [Mucilaginibacter sp.]